MQLEWHDWVGGTGAATLLVTYLLLQINFVSAKSLRYSLLNAVGSAAILVSLHHNFNISAFIIEATWLAISIVGAIVTLRDRGMSKPL